MESLPDRPLLDNRLAPDRLPSDGDVKVDDLQAPAMRAVFSGRFSRALLFETSTTDLVVSFDHWVEGRRTFSDAQATQFYRQLGYSQLLVQTAKNDWFLNDDLPKLLKACGITAQPFQNVVCYGFGMGAYGAMIFSACVRARKVIMVSPQLSINPKKVPFETRWLKEAAAIDFDREQNDDRIARDAEGFVIFDPCERKDARHAARILQLAPGWQAVRLRNSSHPATQVLAEAGTISSFGGELLAPAPRIEELLRLHRAARSASPTYWLSLIERTQIRRPRTAEIALRRALSCKLEKAPASVAFQIGLCAHQAGIAHGLELMDAAINRADNPPPKWNELARAALLQKLRALQGRNRRLELEVQNLKKLTKQYRVTSPIWWYKEIRRAFKK